MRWKNVGTNFTTYTQTYPKLSTDKLKLGNYQNSERKHKKKNLYDLGSGDDFNTHHQKPINKKVNNVDFIKLETSILWKILFRKPKTNYK